MALTDVKAGTLIEDNGGASSLWIKLADQDGNGFSEAYPEAAEFDPFSMKRTADGRAMSYLKGDIVRVPAHWDSKGSYFYLEAQTDVPYGKTLNALYNEGQVGAGKFFDYVGREFLREYPPLSLCVLIHCLLIHHCLAQVMCHPLSIFSIPSGQQLHSWSCKGSCIRRSCNRFWRTQLSQ